MLVKLGGCRNRRSHGVDPDAQSFGSGSSLDSHFVPEEEYRVNGIEITVHTFLSQAPSLSEILVREIGFVCQFMCNVNILDC